jgi:predicted nucleic acid-binding Zn ribbon protein
MNCSKCAAPLPDTARFCLACGAAVADSDARPKHLRWRTTAVLMAGVMLLIVVGAVLFARSTKRLSPPPPAAITQERAPTQAPAPGAAQPAPATVDGYDWSGLSPEELIAARKSLDAAIAREEQNIASRAKGGAPPSPSQNVR